MFGLCDNSKLIGLGVISGEVNGYGKNGAICGALSAVSTFDQIYTKSEVTVRLISLVSSTPYIGGLFGYLVNPANTIINNTYSKAKVISSSTRAGGFIGCLDNHNVSIINSYSNTTSASGNMIGLWLNCRTLTFINSYFNNENGYASINFTSGCTTNGNATGLNSIDLNNNISNNLPPSLWCKGHLLNGIYFFKKIFFKIMQNLKKLNRI